VEGTACRARAAREVLQARGVWEELTARLVRGEGLGHTFHFVQSGNAELGFVTYAQVKRRGDAPRGSWWDVPQALYRPIEQQAVLLEDDPVACTSLASLRGDQARTIIANYGYRLP